MLWAVGALSQVAFILLRTFAHPEHTSLMQAFDVAARLVAFGACVALQPWFRPDAGRQYALYLFAQLIALVTFAAAAWFDVTSSLNSNSYVKYDFEHYTTFSFSEPASPLLALAWSLASWLQCLLVVGLSFEAARGLPEPLRRRLRSAAVVAISGVIVCGSLWYASFLGLKATGWAPLIILTSLPLAILPSFGAVLAVVPVDALFFVATTHRSTWREAQLGPNRWVWPLVVGSFTTALVGSAIAVAGYFAHASFTTCSSDFACRFALGGGVFESAAIGVLSGCAAAAFTIGLSRSPLPERRDRATAA